MPLQTLFQLVIRLKLCILDNKDLFKNTLRKTLIHVKTINQFAQQINMHWFLHQTMFTDGIFKKDFSLAIPIHFQWCP